MLNAYLRLIRFDKPIGPLLLLWPTWWGLILAYHGLPPLGIIFAFSCGVFLTSFAGRAINDVADSNFDGKVARTALRPIATGEITRFAGIVTAVIFSLAAFVVAVIFLQIRTILLSIPALLLLASYPFFKRFFAVPQFYLGIAYSFGILMAFVEQSGHISLVGWLLFVANLLWVLAYDTIYALADIADDLKIGIKTSAITFGRYVIPIVIACYLSFLGLLVVIGIINKLSWIYYFALLVLVVLIVKIYRMIVNKEPQVCFKAFLYNNKLGYTLLLGLIFSYGII